jgi:hypothetical protein
MISHLRKLGKTGIARVAARLQSALSTLVPIAGRRFPGIAGFVRRNPVAVILFCAPLTAIAAIFVWSIVIFPVMHEVKQLDGRSHAAAAGNSSTALAAEKAFLQQQLALSRADSIGFCIDLPDSQLLILIKGVPVRRCAILGYAANSALRYLQKRQLAELLFENLLQTEGSWGTIAKVPIKVRKAPSDSIQAGKAINLPAKPENDDVFFTFAFGRHFMLEVTQTERMSFDSVKRILWYHLRFGFHTVGENMLALATLKMPASWYKLTIVMSKQDARSLYRAIPAKADMALRM